MNVNEEPPVLWGGGSNGDQDVMIRLIPSGLPSHEAEHHSSLAEVMMHSSRLRSCSKSLGATLAPPSSKRKRTPLECRLEVHVDVSFYTDCFQRMYTPFLKRFVGVNYALQLLKVAIQIEYEDLIQSICRYLSCVPWSEEDEATIKRHMASTLFPRRHAPDLVKRVESQGDSRRQIHDLTEQCMRSLHNEDSISSRDLLVELMTTARDPQTATSSTFERHVVRMVTEEAKRMIEEVHDNYDVSWDVLQLAPKLKAIICVLDVLLDAEVGEEGVKCLLRLNNYPSILELIANSQDPEVYSVANEFAGMLLCIAVDATKGKLLLPMTDRVALLKNWSPLFKVMHRLEDFQRMVAALFPTLPFSDQMDLLDHEARNEQYNTFINPRLIARFLKEHWLAEDEADLELAEDEAEMEEEED